VSRADDVKRAEAWLKSKGPANDHWHAASNLADLLAAIRVETFEACAAHLVMRAEQSVPDLVGRISADVLRAGADEIRMLAREAAKETT
jgi:hypothetical protein